MRVKGARKDPPPSGPKQCITPEREDRHHGSITTDLNIECRRPGRRGRFLLRRIIEGSKRCFEILRVQRIFLVRLGTGFPVQPVLHAEK